MERLVTAEALTLLVAAPFIGSFLGLVIDRLPAGRGVLWGRSACTHCGHTLGLSDLVPVLGWIARGGRCRHCGQSIGRIYPLLELATLAIAAWSVWLLPGLLAWAGFGLGASLLVLAAIDRRHRLLPDEIALPLIPAGLAVAWWIDPAKLWSHAAGALAGFVLIMAVRWAYARLRGREGIGIGDAKLMAAAGAWVSWEGLPSVLLLAAAAALLFSLAEAGRTRRLTAQQVVAFGPYIGVGLWTVWLYGPLQIV